MDSKPRIWQGSPLRTGHIYRVRETYTIWNGPGINVEGVYPPPHVRGFRLTRFRPIYPGGELKRLLLEKPVEAKPRQQVPA